MVWTQEAGENKYLCIVLPRFGLLPLPTVFSLLTLLLFLLLLAFQLETTCLDLAIARLEIHA